MFGTIISCFVVGFSSFYLAKVSTSCDWFAVISLFFIRLIYISLLPKAGWINGIDSESPQEALLFGALISAVDPVATLSIMGNADLNCDPLLYSVVFGESVLNDAIAIVLFKTFHKYYNPDGPNLSEAEIPAALAAFIVVSLLSILVGVVLGLAASFMYKHTNMAEYPNLETSLLFSFCYLCYSTAEAMELSGIMALFFQGIVLR